jgi:hypothetical protein
VLGCSLEICTYYTALPLGLLVGAPRHKDCVRPQLIDLSQKRGA